MSGTLNLKIFISISMGLHFLFISITAFLFPDFKLDRLPILNIEVSSLPFVAEEMPISIPVSPARLKSEIKKEEKDTLQRESQEEPSYKKELEPESLQAVQTVAPNIIIEEPKPFPQQSKKEENPLFLKVAPSKVEDLGELRGAPSLEESKNVVKLQPRFEGESLFVQPRYAKNPKPLYPQDARKKGYEGEVILRVEVLSDGRVGQIEVKKSSGYESLDRSALTTVKQWKFIPAKKGEEVISLWVNIPIKFQLR